MTDLKFTCEDEKATFLLRAARLYDEGLRLLPEWIPVSKEMPKEKPSLITGYTTSDPVLVTFVCANSPEPWPRNTVVCECMSWNGKFHHKSYSGDYKAIAWMPKPGPAKEG